jgi:hypothetical protein
MCLSVGNLLALTLHAQPTRQTFIANHDCDSTQNHWPFPKDKVAQGYAYILSHPGEAAVLCDAHARVRHAPARVCCVRGPGLQAVLCAGHCRCNVRLTAALQQRSPRPLPATPHTTPHTTPAHHTGMPTLFWDHLFDWGSTLKGEILAQLKVGGGGSRGQLVVMAVEASRVRLAGAVCVGRGSCLWHWVRPADAAAMRRVCCACAVRCVAGAP